MKPDEPVVGQAQWVALTERFVEVAPDWDAMTEVAYEAARLDPEMGHVRLMVNLAALVRVARRHALDLSGIDDTDLYVISLTPTLESAAEMVASDSAYAGLARQMWEISRREWERRQEDRLRAD